VCGIAGIVNSRFAPDELRGRLLAMRDRLRHRGPDDEGEFLHPEAGTALAHTRLSILDLSQGGHQPMRSIDGRYIIVFNGEIYNFRELRSGLECNGEKFRTQCDTEVLLRLYQRDGAECVHRLEGMFAFAIWDRDEETCFLARDPLGIKPLYFWRQGEALAFASEIRALFQAELGPKRLFAQALYEYFLFGSVQDPFTLVEQIEALPAGHTLLWKRGFGRPECYWRLQFGDDAMSSEEAVERTRAALEDTIRRHFVSDVPVGIFLSGGLDSTAIVALARASGFDQLKTLCISFDDPAYNEGPSAAETARQFGTEHYDWRMTAEEGRRLVNEFVNQIDRPSNDGFNTFCVARLAHERGLKVVLSGVGGDELFGSYASFQLIPKLLAWHQRLGLVKGLRGFAGRVGERMGKRQRIRRLGTYLRTRGCVAEAYWAVRGFFAPDEAKRLVGLYLGDENGAGAVVASENEIPIQPTVRDEISYLEITRYMRNQLLRDSDVMSMAWGLELRVPFVDRKLIDAVGRVPSLHRLAPGKRLLLQAVPEMPAHVMQRPKRGFRFPFDQWVREEWRDIFEEFDRMTAPKLVTWYRHWSLFTLNHFLRVNGLGGPTMDKPPATKQPKRALATSTLKRGVEA
jgi:asparagine synthase (glutamine-hydrolysing)